MRALGKVDDERKRYELERADVLCAPSLGGESFGMVLLEAMAARTLVVASDIDGYRDAVGRDAVLVPPGDPAALAAVLASALATPAPGAARAARSALAARLDSASARAEHWSMARLAEAYERVYRHVVVGTAP